MSDEVKIGSMRNIMDFGLTYFKKINWVEVSKDYGSSEVERLKRERKTLKVDK